MKNLSDIKLFFPSQFLRLVFFFLHFKEIKMQTEDSDKVCRFDSSHYFHQDNPVFFHDWWTLETPCLFIEERSAGSAGRDAFQLHSSGRPTSFYYHYYY